MQPPAVSQRSLRRSFQLGPTQLPGVFSYHIVLSFGIHLLQTVVSVSFCLQGKRERIETCLPWRAGQPHARPPHGARNPCCLTNPWLFPSLSCLIDWVAADIEWNGEPSKVRRLSLFGKEALPSVFRLPTRTMASFRPPVASKDPSLLVKVREFLP